VRLFKLFALELPDNIGSQTILTFTAVCITMSFVSKTHLPNGKIAWLPTFSGSSNAKSFLIKAQS
jgi:hypothetical protein